MYMQAYPFDLLFHGNKSFMENIPCTGEDYTAGRKEQHEIKN